MTDARPYSPGLEGVVAAETGLSYVDGERGRLLYRGYRIGDLGEGEVLAVDLHSHGRLGAFWSADDDRDDNGVRVCGVFGNVDCATPTARFRLVLNGHYVPLPSPWDADDAAEG